MRLAIDNFRFWLITLLTYFTGYLMVEFTIDVSPAIVISRDIGFAIIIYESVSIWIRGDLEIFVYPVFMPNREIQMEVFGQAVRQNKFRCYLKLFSVDVKSEIWMEQSKVYPHFKLLDIFNVAALVDAYNTEALGDGKLVMQVSEHLGRATAKPYRVPSMAVEGCLWVSVVRLVYITVFGAILTILASATHLFFKHRDIEHFRPFKGRPCCDAFAELYVMPKVEVISVFIRIEFFSHKNISV